MAVAFVGGGSAVASGTTSHAITYSPTAGNTVVAAIMFAQATYSGLTCVDNNNHALTAVTTSGGLLNLFIGTAITGATRYTFSWTTSETVALVLGEYSGVVGTGTNGTNSGSTSPAQVSVVSTKANSFMVAALGVKGISNTFTAVTGNLRESDDNSSVSAALMDNTAASSGSSITNSASLSAVTAWDAAAVEIYPTQPASGTVNLLMMMGAGT
jgi:hypothetical protein